jgi:hypothetical protein
MTRLAVALAVACACNRGSHEPSESEQMQALPIAAVVEGRHVTLPKATPKVGDVVTCKHDSETRGLDELAGHASRFAIRELTTREWTVLDVRAGNEIRVQVAYPDEQRSHLADGDSVPEPILLREHAYVVELHDDGTLAIRRADGADAMSPEEEQRVRSDVAGELTRVDPIAPLVGVELVSGRVLDLPADAVQAQVGDGAKVRHAEARLVDVRDGTAFIETHADGNIAALSLESRAVSTWDIATGRVVQVAGVMVSHGTSDRGIVTTGRGTWTETCTFR